MKQFFFWIFVVVLLSISSFLLFTQREQHTNSFKFEKSVQAPITPTVRPISHVTKTLFVPYWAVGQKVNTSGYDQLIYFGITANTTGIATNDPGYSSIDHFFAATSSTSAKRLLGIRMITTDVNEQVLTDMVAQQKIIRQSIDIAKEKGFDGIVLDFEISALGFDEVTKNISTFEDVYGDTVRSNHLQFFTTMYGDTFARFRPFDVKTIASHSDGIMVMAYDFHKVNGNPGPNFPLQDNQNEGYDFKTMISDFLQQVPPEKMTVIFGLYGYDWLVDSTGTSMQPAISLSDNQIQKKFLNGCLFTDCTLRVDPVAAETKITYTDANNEKHIVWFENMQSITKKTDYLESKGIGSIAYWAYSYF